MTVPEESVPPPASAAEWHAEQSDAAQVAELPQHMYVLYDFDAGHLVTTRLFSSEGEAADMADALSNVLVIPLPLPRPRL
jgi:hypothetical protein